MRAFHDPNQQAEKLSMGRVGHPPRTDSWSFVGSGGRCL